ncbi:hypothetical protein Ddc_17975 [Ditylenchus destructor]|nr:hypothetical protein Ddc_17975 [Ditylenchus destructor]
MSAVRCLVQSLNEEPIVHKCQDVLVVLFSILSVVLFLRILFLYFFQRNVSLRIQTLSRCMITYMSFNVVGMSVMLPCSVAQSDTVVKITSVLELCLEFLPNLLIFIKSHFHLGFCILYVDRLPEITQCLNSAICGLIYNKVLSVKKDKVTPLTTSTTGNANNLSLAVPQATLNVANKSVNVTHVTHVTSINRDFCNSHMNNTVLEAK